MPDTVRGQHLVNNNVDTDTNAGTLFQIYMRRRKSKDYADTCKLVRTEVVFLAC